MNDTLLSVSEAAERIGVTRQAVQTAITDHRLPAIRIGTRWVIREADVESYVIAPGGKGRTRGNAGKAEEATL